MLIYIQKEGRISEKEEWIKICGESYILIVTELQKYNIGCWHNGIELLSIHKDNITALINKFKNDKATCVKDICKGIMSFIVFITTTLTFLRGC